MLRIYNFFRFLSVSSMYTGGYPPSSANYNISNFVLKIITLLPPSGAIQCRQQYSSLVSSLTSSLNTSNPTGLANNIASNPSQISFLTPSQLQSVGLSSPSAAVSIAQSLDTNGIKLSPVMAKSKLYVL